MENWEQKYKEAQTKMSEFLKKYNNKIISSTGTIYKELESIFPELAESEDEKIRKELIETVHLAYDCGCSLNKVQRDDYVAYLEKKRYSEFELENEYWRGYDDGKKQDEQKPADVDYNPFDDFRKSDSETNPSEFDARLNALLKEFESLPKEELVNSLAFYLNVVQNDGNYNKQKPAWSEEDEEMANRVLECLKNGYRKLPTDIKMLESWLNSLKCRCVLQQKPANKIEE